MNDTDKVYYVKSVKEREGSVIIWSDVHKAPPEEISDFKSKKCNHDADKLLIYDEFGPVYISRYCGVCGSLIGYI